MIVLLFLSYHVAIILLHCTDTLEDCNYNTDSSTKTKVQSKTIVIVILSLGVTSLILLVALPYIYYHHHEKKSFESLMDMNEMNNDHEKRIETI